MKRATMLCLAFLLCVCLRATEYWSSGFFCQLGYSSGSGKTVPVEGSISVSKEFRPFSLFSGLNSNAFGSDITLKFSIVPVSLSFMSFGVEYVFHACLYHQLQGTELDTAVMLKAEFFSPGVNRFMFSVFAGMDVKSIALILPNMVIQMPNTFPVARLQFLQRFLTRHEILFYIATFETYYFPLFANPVFALGYSYDLTKELTSGILLSAQYTDFFTNTSTVDGVQIKAFFGCKL